MFAHFASARPCGTLCRKSFLKKQTVCMPTSKYMYVYTCMYIHMYAHTIIYIHKCTYIHVMNKCALSKNLTKYNPSRVMNVYISINIYTRT